MTTTPDTAAMVTGAARNIGREIALALADDGYDIVLAVRRDTDAVQRVRTEVEQRGRRALVGVADVRDARAVADVVAAAREAMGPVTVLVNNAAIRPGGDFLDLTREDFDEVVGTILGGSATCSQAVLPGMLARGWGRIVNIAGMSGQTGAPGRAHVVAAKSGVIGLTKALALEYAGRGVTVNAVSPGFIDTVRDSLPGHHGSTPIPVGRMGDTAEVAAAVRYLVSPAADYVTGQTLNVNGGAHLSS